MHPEDDPSSTGEIEENEEYYTTRLPTSVRRYDFPQDGEVIESGNKRIIVHYGEPPLHRRKSLEQPKREKKRFHVLFYVGIFLSMLVVGALILNLLGLVGSIWQQKQDDWTFGNPRTYQVDVNVGHGTAQIPVSHFIALNLNGSIQVIEEPGDDVSKARSYYITTVPGNENNPPVKLVFQDLNRDGKLDMLVEIGDAGNITTFMLFNNGTQFTSKL